MRPLDTSAVITYYLLFGRVVSIGVRAIFWRGLDRFCPKNMGQRPKNELQN